MRDLKRIPVARLRADPDQPRKQFEEAALLALADSLKRLGQQVPLIVFDDVILDGERRWRACKLAGIVEVDAIVPATRPTKVELQLLQITLDAHRTNLSPMERSDFLARIKQDNGWSVSELAERLSMKQPLVSRLLKYQDGCDDLRAALQAGTLDQDKAYTICQEPDAEKQRQLLGEASGLTREQLRQKARPGTTPAEIKASIARFPLPTGVSITVAGQRMTLAGVIEAMLETVKELKKGQAEHWDVTTAMRVMRDRSRAAK